MDVLTDEKKKRNKYTKKMKKKIQKWDVLKNSTSLDDEKVRLKKKKKKRLKNRLKKKKKKKRLKRWSSHI